MQTQTEKPRSSYTLVIKISSWTFAAVTAIVCIITFFVLISQGTDAELPGQIGQPKKRIPIAGLLFMPVGGYMAGMALAILFAPKSHLLSPAGEKWMKMVGVKKVGAARLVSLIFAIIGLAILVFIALALLTNDFKKPLF